MRSNNSVKEAAATGKQIRGVHLTFAAPAIIEVLAAVDIQFVYIDGEHGCFDWRDIETGCIAAERHDLTPIARISDASQATITRFLDRGIRGIVAPHIESLDAARQVIHCAYFSPLGSRSFGAASRTACTTDSTCARCEGGNSAPPAGTSSGMSSGESRSSM